MDPGKIQNCSAASYVFVGWARDLGSLLPFSPYAVRLRCTPSPGSCLAPRKHSSVCIAPYVLPLVVVGWFVLSIGAQKIGFGLLAFSPLAVQDTEGVAFGVPLDISIAISISPILSFEGELGHLTYSSYPSFTRAIGPVPDPPFQNVVNGNGDSIMAHLSQSFQEGPRRVPTRSASRRT
ncbi:hypothetical protein RhiJN_24506 [Ceratobasidium sp. AG-Ba]|nr:hypothetical protein RhiJN_24506 [Ceratobasidium sp. AG-Ba]